jgi:hypothetical protein
MGFYRPSYLQYLTGDYSTASMAFNMDTQEKRISSVTSLVKEILPKVSKIPSPTYDSSLLYAMDRIKTEMLPFGVTVVQSVWRMHVCRSLYLKKLGSSRKIQDFWRRYWKLVKPAKKELARLKMEKKVGGACIKIQSAWRGFLARRQAAAIRLAQEEQDAFMVKFKKPADDLDELGGDGKDEALDDWLNNVKTNEFDEEMDNYLGNEELVHYNKSLNPDAFHLLPSKPRSTSRQALERIANRVCFHF